MFAPASSAGRFIAIEIFYSLVSISASSNLSEGWKVFHRFAGYDVLILSGQPAHAAASLKWNSITT